VKQDGKIFKGKIDRFNGKTAERLFNPGKGAKELQRA
jgi:hypothetical protein